MDIQFLYCTDGKTRILKRRPRGAVVYGNKVGKVIYSDFLHIVAGGGFGWAWNRGRGVRYLLVPVGDITGCTCLGSSAKCYVTIMAESLPRCK